MHWKASPSSRRAWIEIDGEDDIQADDVSPSSRRAWIEICKKPRDRLIGRVALLAEGVDRNNQALQGAPQAIGRPPRGGRG